MIVIQFPGYPIAICLLTHACLSFYTTELKGTTLHMYNQSSYTTGLKSATMQMYNQYI